MQAKLTKLASALLLAGMAGGAHAQILATDTGNGELFFSVWDPERGTSYTRDLGIRMNDLLPASVATAQGTILSFSADALLTQYLADTVAASGNLDNLVWNLGAGDNLGLNGTAGSLRGLYSGNFTEAEVELRNSNQFNNALGNMNIQIAQVNTQPTHTSQPHGSNRADQGGDIADDFAYAGQATWGPTSGGMGVITTATVGSTSNFWFIKNAAGNTAKVVAEQYFGALGAAVWTFASDGTLTFAAPVPEAETWALLGLGLLGLGFYARRRAGEGAAMPALA